MQKHKLECKAAAVFEHETHTKSQKTVISVSSRMKKCTVQRAPKRHVCNSRGQASTTLAGGKRMLPGKSWVAGRKTRRTIIFLPVHDESTNYTVICIAHKRLTLLPNGKGRKGRGVSLVWCPALRVREDGRGVAKGWPSSPPILRTKHKHTYKLHKICQLGQFIFGKIIKTVATRCYLLKLKCTKFDSQPQTLLGDLTALPQIS